MNVNLRPEKYLKYLYLPNLFGTDRTKEILHVNPTVVPERVEPEESMIFVFDYNGDTIEEKQLTSISECFDYKDSKRISWINIDGLKKANVEAISELYNIHSLIAEDILSIGQRPKMDEVDGVMYCLLNMLYFNDQKKTVETEQISLVLGTDFVISFQEDANRDVFDPLRHKLKIPRSQIRQRSADYLLYAMLDMIVDNYFLVMEKLGEKIEGLEEDIVRSPNTRSLAKINMLRKEMIILKRSVVPVRELVNGILRSDSVLVEERTEKYFKDVYDHIVQATDLAENYRDMMMNLHDLYLSNVNLKMNEVMKVMAVVTCLLAPATVIGGIFGMNFESIPLLHNKWGFFISVGLMLFIPLAMIRMFRRRGWF